MRSAIKRQAGNAWTRKYQGKFLSVEIPPVPTTKPAYRGFRIGLDGQIWVQRYTTAVKKPAEDARPPDADHRPAQTWREPPLYDVFEPDGTYLGEVRFPEGVSLLAHRGSEVWGLGSGDAGEVHVIRYRLATSSR